MLEPRTAHLLHVEDDSLCIMGMQRAFKRAKIAIPISFAHDGIGALDMLRGTNGCPAFSASIPDITGPQHAPDGRNRVPSRIAQGRRSEEKRRVRLHHVGAPLKTRSGPTISAWPATSSRALPTYCRKRPLCSTPIGAWSNSPDSSRVPTAAADQAPPAIDVSRGPACFAFP